MKPLVILAGPTAVGKTALSIKLAKKINGAVISADSMQVYKHMDIGSAKVMPEEMEGIPHYLIDVMTRLILSQISHQTTNPRPDIMINPTLVKFTIGSATY